MCSLWLSSSSQCLLWQVITGGAESSVRHWAVNGDTITSVPSSLTHVFALAHNSTAPQYEVCVCVCARACVRVTLYFTTCFQVLAVAGDSADINVFTNLGYKAFSLTISVPSWSSSDLPSVIPDFLFTFISHPIGSNYYQLSVVQYEVWLPSLRL